jgi:hypothetical protein
VGNRQARIRNAEGIDPADFRIEPENLPERVDDPPKQDHDDQRIEAGIGLEGVPELRQQDCSYQADEHEEDEHPHKVDARR